MATTVNRSTAKTRSDKDPNMQQPKRGRLLREQDEVKFLMMLRSLLGIAALFLAVNFNAVVQAEVNVAISSVGGRYFDGRVEIPVPAFGQDDPRWSDVRLGP